MKHIFILNTFGKKDPYLIRNEIFKYCVQNDMDYSIIYNKDEDTEKIVNMNAKDGNVIYAVGGDGMINRVLNGLVNTNAILGYIPYGTGNDFNKAMKKLDEGIHEVNVGKINDKYFINVACFGLDADTANDERFIHNEKLPEKMRYPASALYHFAKYSPKELEVYYYRGSDLHGEWDKYSTIAVCNGNFYGNGFNIAPEANVQDNLFDIYMVSKLKRLELANTILKMKYGKHELMKGVEKIQTDNINIFSRFPIKANVDGEVLESDEFQIRLDNNIKVYNNQELNMLIEEYLEKENDKVKKRILHKFFM